MVSPGTMQRATGSGRVSAGDGGKAAAKAFAAFVAAVEPRLRRAYIGWCGVDDAHDATAEALAYAWEHWDEVQTMDNPAGYLYRVGQTRSRVRKEGRLPSPADLGLPDIEPGLIPALRALPDQQRTSVWLV